MSLTYISIFFFNKITTREFQDKVKIAAENIINIYKNKENMIKKSTLALAESELFTGNFELNPQIVSSIFKIFLSANGDFIKIMYADASAKPVVECRKIDNEIICMESSDIKIKKTDKFLTEEKMSPKGLLFETIAPIHNNKKNGYIVLQSYIKPFFGSSNFYNLLLIDKEGKIYYSNFLNYKSVFDIFTYTLADRIRHAKNRFVTNDIYVITLNKKYKLVFIQNKKLINKTNSISQKLAMVMVLISIFLAIPLGVFFSKPLYNFYKELDKKVNEEIRKTKEKDQILMHQSKLAALGEMLGNIAHQWRHPLTRLSLLIQNLEMAYKNKKLDDEFFEKFKNRASSQIEYMSQTIDDFTNFFKKDSKKEEFLPSEIIKKAIQLMESRIKQNSVEINVLIKKDNSIKGFKSEFSQVVLNILNNAIDVLKERNIENKKIWIYIDDDIIKIEDNAGGIPEEIKDKIFEPYFTTKFQSQGTGIGLYMSRVIITQHFNGELYAYNSSKGAVFVIKIGNNE